MRKSVLAVLGHVTLGTVILAGATSALAADPAQVARGQVVFEHWCVPCHGAGEKGHAGTMALGVKYKGSVPAELSKRTDLTPETIDYFLRNGVSIMPPFRPTEVTVSDEKDLIAYLTRNSK
jgi:mono/diheme cytochrome c family protein